MSNTQKQDLSVYEIGYLIVSSIPEEKIPETVEDIKRIITDSGAVILSEESPVRQSLAYTMRRKTVSGAYEKYDLAYFGWVKFELDSASIDAVKKTIEIHPAILRMIILSTVRENTYLGKRASMLSRQDVVPSPDRSEDKSVAPATVEEMDKSIDDMVKEA